MESYEIEIYKNGYCTVDIETYESKHAKSYEQLEAVCTKLCTGFRRQI